MKKVKTRTHQEEPRKQPQDQGIVRTWGAAVLRPYGRGCGDLVQNKKHDLAGLKTGHYITGRSGQTRGQLRNCSLLLVCAMAAVCGCGRGARRGPGEVVFVIESNPANLDPRYATDGQSQRIDRLIFNGLVERDAEMNLHGDLAEKWETPDALTYVFHLRRGVKFHDGRELTSRDVKATIEYMMNAENKSPKRGAFPMIASIETPDAETVIFHLKEAYASFLWNLEKSAVGIVPAGAGSDFGRKPIGTGPFRFVSQAQDEAVVLERREERERITTEDTEGPQSTQRRKDKGQRRDAEYAEGSPRRETQGEGKSKVESLKLKVSEGKNPGQRPGNKSGEEERVTQDPPSQNEDRAPTRSGDPADMGRSSAAPLHGEGRAASTINESGRVQRVTFRIVPDAIVRALELRKGSADVEMSSLSPDMIPVLAKRTELEVTERPGTNFAYLGVNLEDPTLAKREVRQALAYATDRESLIKYLLRDEARLASGILPPNHWAYEGNVKKYGYDPAEAERLLDAAGLRRGTDGTRMHLTVKVTTQEAARLLGAALQDQWKKVGVALEVRPLETATFFSDLAKGNFQLSYSIWIGANNDPDVFDLVFSSKRMPPNGSNRGHYRNARVDELIAGIRAEMDREKRKALCSEVQKIVAEDLPYVPLWYVDVVSVHRRTMGRVGLTPTGDYDFLVK